MNYIKILLVRTNNVLTLLMLCTFSTINAQEELIFDTAYVDTIGIQVSAGFTTDDFIRMTKEDTSFYRAFKNLKLYPHKSTSNVKIFNKNWEEIGKMNRSASHYSDGSYGWINVDKETTDGKFYNRKNEHKFFTAEMYDKVFFQQGKFPVGNTVDSVYVQKKAVNRTKEEKYYEQLKTFMFSPGTGVDGVPLIGKKLNIFEGKMKELYDFTLEKTKFRDSIPCYKFSVKVKEGINPEKVVIKNLTTFYDRRTMKIIARTYQLKQSTIAFSFNIQMYIRLGLKYDEYLPLEIKYNGEWDIPFKKPERITFQMKCKNYTKFD